MDSYVNHIKEYRWICVYYAIGLNSILFLMIVTNISQEYLRENYSLQNLSVFILIGFFVALQACTSTIITISFIILLQNVFKRFSALNSILRFQSIRFHFICALFKFLLLKFSFLSRTAIDL